MSDKTTLENLEASVLEKIDGDEEFQSSLEGLSDEDKTSKIDERKSGDLESALSNMSEKAGRTDAAEKKATDQEKRAEIAEKGGKKAKSGKKEDNSQEEKKEGLSVEDGLALTDAQIHPDDRDQVIKTAKILDKTIGEALKDETLISILKTRAEERKTGDATQTKGGRRGSSPDKGADLLRRAEETGEVPTDKAGMDKLVEARMARLKAGASNKQ